MRSSWNAIPFFSRLISQLRRFASPAISLINFTQIQRRFSQWLRRRHPAKFQCADISAIYIDGSAKPSVLLPDKLIREKKTQTAEVHNVKHRLVAADQPESAPLASARGD
jgi:hypothetical protein